MKKAFKPEEITEILLGYLKEGNLDGVVSLYEDDAIFVSGEHQMVRGKEEIRKVFASLIARNPDYEGGKIKPAIVNGDVALTSSVLADGRVTAEIARRQSDGSWLWYIDQPAISGIRSY